MGGEAGLAGPDGVKVDMVMGVMTVEKVEAGGVGGGDRPGAVEVSKYLNCQRQNSKT